MERFSLLDGTDTLKESREVINDNLLSVRSLQSGTEFPTENLAEGMMCYRTDVGKIYQYINNKWTSDIPVDISGSSTSCTGNAATADHAATADTCIGNAATATRADTADKCTGNAATASKLQSAVDINGVAFDGTKDVSFDVGVKTVDGKTPDENGNVNVGGLPVGFSYITMNPNLTTGLLPLFGGEYSRTAYADLWNWVQDQGLVITEAEWQERAEVNHGNVPRYSDGDGSATFRLPSMNCWIKCAGSLEKVGSYIEAGLPNITGSFMAEAALSGGHPPDGAFYSDLETATGASGGGTDHIVYFDASRSNDIYGASDTVQPPSLVGMWVVVAFGTVSNFGNQDIADISSNFARIEGKVDEYNNNVAYIDSFVVESWQSGTEWYRIWSDGLIEQGGQTDATSGNTARTITMYGAYVDTNYSLILGSGSGGSGSSRYNNFQWTDKTTNTFTAKAECSENLVMNWYARGMGATT